MNRHEPTIAVLIVNYYTYPDTIRFVQDLKRQQGIQLSVLIVDNCSPNGAFSILQKNFKDDPIVQLIQSERNGGYAYGNNFGLAYLQARPVDYVLISNNDVELKEPFLLQKMAAAHERLDKVGFVAPRMYVAGKENTKHQAYRTPRYKDSFFASLRSLYWLAQKLHWTNTYTFDENDTGNRPVDCVSGAFFMGAKSVFFEIGLFDEHTFLYCEEAILSKKLAVAGKQNYQLRSLSIDHIDSQTTRRLNSKYRLQREWLKSTVYYHRAYGKCGMAGIILLKMLYFFWVLETVIVDLIRKSGRS